MIAGFVIAIVLLAGGLWLYSALPQPQTGFTMTGKLGLTAMDKLAGSLDAATTDVYIYRKIGGNLVQQEMVDLAAASTDSALTYTTGELLYLRVVDPTDTSLCTQFLQWTVPFATTSEVENGVFEVSIDTIDRGDVAISVNRYWLNGTSLGNINTTTENYDDELVTFEWTLRQPTDDKGYVNTYNFLQGYENNHYFYIQISGTGWDRVSLKNSVSTFVRNNIRYYAIPLSDVDLTRDLQSNSVYDPEGFWSKQLTWDFTAMTSGDNVTVASGYRYYSSWDYFQEGGSWGADSAATAGTTFYVGL